LRMLFASERGESKCLTQGDTLSLPRTYEPNHIDDGLARANSRLYSIYENCAGVSQRVRQQKRNTLQTLRKRPITDSPQNEPRLVVRNS